MKKQLLLIAFAFANIYASGQLIFDHGPIVNQLGVGSGGADVSALHNNMTTFGFRESLLAPTYNYRIGDSFDIPTNETWTIDSVVIYSYQTGSGITSSSSGVSCAVYNGSPAMGGTIILGDETSNILGSSVWTGVYRTTATTFTNTDRPIMANTVVPTSTWTLTTGTYWLSWQVEGNSTLTGPWGPPITYSTQTITGNALQYNGTTWNAIIDTVALGAADDAPQGFPFLIYGSVAPTGIQTVGGNGVQVLTYPNPVRDICQVKINAPSGMIRPGASFDFFVYDATGRMVKKISGVENSGFVFDRTGLSSGVYSYELFCDQQSIKKDKLIIQ
jgi:hypothetical protein